MQKLLRTSQLLQQVEKFRYYHYDRAGNSLMGSPYECPPPKSYWKTGTLFDSYPDQFGGFKVHPINPYQMQAIAHYDNWEYSYHGQWWDIGSLFWNCVAVVFPIVFYTAISLQNQNCKYLKDCEMKKYHDHGGQPPYNVQFDYNKSID